MTQKLVDLRGIQVASLLVTGAIRDSWVTYLKERQ